MLGSAVSFIAGGPARIQALIIGALALAAVCLALVTWALLERSGRLSLEIKLVTCKAQQDALSNALDRQNEGIAKLGDAGKSTVEETRRLLKMVETGLLKTAALRDEAKAIVGRPPPVRADGKPKDCGDALEEIKARVKP